MSLIGCWKANTRDVFILKIVEDPRNEVALVQRTLANHSPSAFLEEIRCFATFVLAHSPSAFVALQHSNFN
jgi:hypothetical protein